MTKPYVKLLIAFTAVFTVLLLFIPRTGKFACDFEKGKQWKYETLFAQFDFPVIKTEDQIQEELGRASRRIIPYYRYRDNVPSSIMAKSGEFPSAYFRSAVSELLEQIYSKGVIPDSDFRPGAGEELSDIIYIQRDKRAIKSPLENVYRLSYARSKLLSDLEHLFPEDNVDLVLRESSVYELLVPNLVFDSQTTSLVNSEESSSVSPTSGYVRAGQLIVSKGELVTAEIAQML